MRILQFLILAFFCYQTECKQLYPAILVPGDGGARIEGKLNKTSPGPFPLCSEMTDDYYTLWVELTSLLPIVLECFVDNFRLVYNNKTHKTSYPNGVDIRIPNFGDTDTVEWLSRQHISSKLGYYATLVTSLTQWGYVRNKSVRGAPYDFRKAPNELDEYYMNLTRLIEETYAINDNTKVVIIAHSLGNLVILYFLNHKPQEWKDKYIRSFITLAAPWGGSVKTLRMLASGDNVNILTMKALKARPVQRSMTSSAFLMPSDQFWNRSEVLIQTPIRNYTVADYKQFFADLNYNDGYLMREDTENLVNPLRSPNVEVHCLYGTGFPTAGSYIYSEGQWPDEQPKPLYDDGDRTVNIRSLQGCLPWKRLQRQPFYFKAFSGIAHMDILKHTDVINHLKEILLNS